MIVRIGREISHKVGDGNLKLHMNEQPHIASVGNRVLKVWTKCNRLPMGRFIFNQMFARVAPFNAVIRPRVLEVTPGRARVAMKERRRLHQHLKSVHAGALFTLAECTSGLAMAASIPDTMRIIVTDISIEFIKKARGLLVAEATCDMPDPAVEQRHEVRVDVTDEVGDAIAHATVRWLVGPNRKGSSPPTLPRFEL
jgi:uncharacterized protein (TIGR00369 family)